MNLQLKTKGDEEKIIFAINFEMNFSFRSFKVNSLGSLSKWIRPNILSYIDDDRVFRILFTKNFENRARPSCVTVNNTIDYLVKGNGRHMLTEVIHHLGTARSRVARSVGK